MTLSFLNTVDPMSRFLDDIASGFLVYPERAPVARTRPFRLDIAEVKGAYQIVAELPGVKKEDIRVDIDGTRVTIAAEYAVDKQSKSSVGKSSSDKSSTGNPLSDKSSSDNTGQSCCAPSVAPSEVEGTDIRVLHTERMGGHLSRSFELTHEVDSTAAVARYEDGLLKLHLPHKTSTAGRSLVIQ